MASFVRFRNLILNPDQIVSIELLICSDHDLTKFPAWAIQERRIFRFKLANADVFYVQHGFDGMNRLFEILSIEDDLTPTKFVEVTSLEGVGRLPVGVDVIFKRKPETAGPAAPTANG